jgi:hypothetical protein
VKALRRHVITLIILALVFVAFLLWAIPALADEAAPVITIEYSPTPSPTPLPPPSTLPVPPVTPTPTPELPDYDYPSEDARCLSRGIWSVCPRNPTHDTRVALCELVQNRVDDSSGDFEDSVRWVLLQGNEFPSYDPDAHRSQENNEIADYAMRAWIYAAVTGDRSYRLVPPEGLYCDFYRLDGWDYIKIYNRAGDVVYDSGADQ